jgi:hypothetical protein
MFVDVRIILAALWVAVAFCLAFGAILGFFKPGYIQGLMDGEIDGIKVTQNVLIGNAVLMVIPGVMGFLSLTVPYPMIRWVNLFVCVVYGVQILMAYAYYLTYKIQTWRYYNVLKVAEVILYALIIWYNWNWV